MNIKSVYNIGDVLAVKTYEHDYGEYMFGEVTEVHVGKGGKISYTIDFGYEVSGNGTTAIINEAKESDCEYYEIIYKVGENKNHIVESED